jgi:hypothetical protein
MGELPSFNAIDETGVAAGALSVGLPATLPFLKDDIPAVAAAGVIAASGPPKSDAEPSFKLELESGEWPGPCGLGGEAGDFVSMSVKYLVRACLPCG